MDDASAGSPSTPAPKWKPLSATERRVLGVLVEKAKTTPEAYPLTLNAVRTGANQKNNRFPQMQLEPDSVEESLERLRELEAVTEVISDGRVPKYRHRAYDWLGVDKVELAVMVELLLRGAQTVGELRGRAARMEPIADLQALQPILQGLQAKNLLVYLSPPGRGAVVTHNLYSPSEMEKLKREHGGAAASPSAMEAIRDLARADAPAVVAPQANASAASADGVEALQREVAELRAELSELDATVDQLRRSLDEVRQQLGL